MSDGLLRAKFVPWHRSLVQVTGFAGGVGLWLAGTHDAPPLGWTAHVAWVPFIALTFINTHWHKQAERRAAAARTGQ